VTSALQAPSVSIGLTPDEAALGAEIGSNLVLAPITGPLEQASTLLRAVELVAAFATGNHVLLVACIRPLVHTGLEHALTKCVATLISGSDASGRRSAAAPLPPAFKERQEAARSRAATSLARPTQEPRHTLQVAPQPGPHVAPEVRRDSARSDPVWLCFAFASRPSPSSSVTPTEAAARTGSEPDVSEPIVLRPGETEFLTTLGEELRGGKLSKVAVPTALTLHDLAGGQYFVLQIGGASSAGLATGNDSQDDHQHQGCSSGSCTRRGGPPCQCECFVCTST
jgi:hypothetical protein